MKSAKSYIVALCLLLAAALCLPLMGCSPKEEVSISDQTIEFVKGIQQPVTIYWMCYNKETDERTAELLRHYTEANSNLSLTVIDPWHDDPAATDVVKTYGLQPNQSLIIECPITGRSRIVTPNDIYYYVNDYINSQYADYLGQGEYYKMTLEELEYQIEFNAREQGFDLLANSTTAKFFGGEAAIGAALDYVTSDRVAELSYVLSSHGHGVSDDLMNRLSLKALDLTTTQSIPLDAGCIIMCDPTEDITAEEAALLSAYLEKGGSLLLTTGADCEGYTNLMSLCAVFGLSMQAGAVSDATLAESAKTPTTILPKVNVQNVVGELSQQYNRLLTMVAPHHIVIPEQSELPEKVGVSLLFSASESATLVASAEDPTVLDSQGSYCVAVTAAKSLNDERTLSATLCWYAATDLFSQPIVDQAENTHLFYMAATLNTLVTPFTSAYASLPGLIVPLDITRG